MSNSQEQQKRIQMNRMTYLKIKELIPKVLVKNEAAHELVDHLSILFYKDDMDILERRIKEQTLSKEVEKSLQMFQSDVSLWRLSINEDDEREEDIFIIVQYKNKEAYIENHEQVLSIIKKLGQKERLVVKLKDKIESLVLHYDSSSELSSQFEVDLAE